MAGPPQDLRRAGLTISVYSAEPGSRSEQALDLLASWTATPESSPTTVEE